MSKQQAWAERRFEKMGKVETEKPKLMSKHDEDLWFKIAKIISAGCHHGKTDDELIQEPYVVRATSLIYELLADERRKVIEEVEKALPKNRCALYKGKSRDYQVFSSEDEGYNNALIFFRELLEKMRGNP